MQQGRSYLDGATGMVREIDVLAAPRSSSSLVDVRLVVECKRTDRTPWVVLTSESLHGPEDVIAATVSTTSAREFLTSRARSASSGVPEFLSISARHGFSVVQAHRKPDDDKPEQPFKAMSQAVSAAVARVGSEGAGWRVAWPVVVIDGPLFEVTATQSGDEIAATDSARVMWHGAFASQPVILDIVRKPALHEYAHRAYAGLRSVQSDLETALDESSKNREVLGLPLRTARRR